MAQTRSEDYAYITNGIKLQLSAGLNGKEGYHLKEYKLPGVPGNVVTYLLVEDATMRRCGTVMIVTTTGLFSKTVYLCIPAPGTEQGIYMRCYNDWLQTMQVTSGSAGMSEYMFAAMVQVQHTIAPR